MTDQAAQKTNQARQRKAVVPPPVVRPEMSLFEYLAECVPPLDQKIIDIACSQRQVPPELKKDAAQEIRLMWSTLQPDTAKYKPGQIAAYAHHMAGHAALRLRRDLGSSVRLPGSAFRKKKDGSSYVTPGVLAAPIEWDKMESWFNADGAESGDTAAVSDAISSDLGLSFGAALVSEDEPIVEQDEDEVVRDERLDFLQGHKDDLTPRQMAIITALVQGATFDEVMLEQNIKRGVLMREMAVITSIFGAAADLLG